MSSDKLLRALAVVAIIVLIYWFVVKRSPEGFNPGYYTNGESQRLIPVLLDGSGTDSDFWFRDRQNDRINGFYKGSNLSRTSCDVVQNYEKMLPWGSKIYTDGGSIYSNM